MRGMDGGWLGLPVESFESIFGGGSIWNACRGGWGSDVSGAEQVFSGLVTMLHHLHDVVAECVRAVLPFSRRLDGFEKD